MEDDIRKIVEKYSGLENTPINRLQIKHEINSFIRTNYSNQIYSWKVQCDEENNTSDMDNIFINVYYVQKHRSFSINQLWIKTNPIKIIRRKKLDQINETIR